MVREWGLTSWRPLAERGLFEDEILERLPAEIRDAPMRKLITESRLRR